MKKDFDLFIDDILECIDIIELYVKGVKKRDFFLSGNIQKTIKLQDAVIRRIEIIGEAASCIPPYVRRKYPAVDWKKIVGMRNRLIHKYFEIDLEVAWAVATNEIKILKKQMLKIKKDLGKNK